MSQGGSEAEALAAGGLQWLLRVARETGDGFAWPGSADDAEVDYSLYAGSAGIVLTLLEGYRHFGDDRYADAAVRGARAITAVLDHTDDCSLYIGLTGMALALNAVDDVLGDAAAGTAANHAFDLVRSRFDGQRWGAFFDLIGGNAGIALGALAAGHPDLAVLAVTPYLHTFEPTPGGVQWEVCTGDPIRLHHMSHGTLGVVHALAAVGHATDSPRLIELALAGAADVVSRNESDERGFVVPICDSEYWPELTERYSFGWCHGPTGDAQTFRLLAAVTADLAWRTLTDRCWHTIAASGLPHRLRPGFWDNSGHCCGTAGVLALACDRQVESGENQRFASTLVHDLAARALVDRDGVRWSNYEHSESPSTLQPRTDWAHGNAGIVRELLRFTRAGKGAASTYAVLWPDHPPALGGAAG